MTDANHLKIINLVVENLKRISVVSITPTGELVQITGKNGQGKTSVLDSIWWAFQGAANIQVDPIRRGQQKATIKVRLGNGTDTAADIVVTRTLDRKDGKTTTKLFITNGDGTARFDKPQDMLNGMASGISFDPLEFSRMPAKDQFEALKKLSKLDFIESDTKNTADYARRTDVNRTVRELTAQYEAIAIPDVVPETVDEAAIVAEIGRAGTHNGEIEMRRERRENTVTAIEGNKDRARQLQAKAVKLRQEADDCDREAGLFDKEAAELQGKLDTAEPLPEPMDAAALTAKLEAAKRTNALRARALRRQELQAAANAQQAEADALTARIEERTAAKQAAIAAVKMPVDGLGFGDGMITLNDLPFDQASDSEKLRVSIAIAMAANPKLRVIRVRDGSLLDADALKLIAEMAKGQEFQVWIESVSDAGNIGVVMEDGHVASTPESRAQGSLM